MKPGTTAIEVTIKLEPWQNRQLVVFNKMQKLPLRNIERIKKIVVRPGKGGCLASYKVIQDCRKRYEIFLTDAQIEAVRKVLGPDTEVISISISDRALKSQGLEFLQ